MSIKVGRFAGAILLLGSWAFSGCSKEPKQASPAEIRGAAVTRFRTAVDALCSTPPSQEAREAAFAPLVEAAAAASAAGADNELEPQRGLIAAVQSVTWQMSEIDKALLADEVPEPTKPVYEKPVYSGAWRLSGQYRGPFNGGGIVVQRGEYYFVVRDADPAETPYVNGYVEDTGETVTLALGRDGREAGVVKLSDRESYADDQSAYREEVAEAQAIYKSELREYPQELRAWKAGAAARESARTDRQRERRGLESKRATLIADLASRCGPGKAAAP